MKKTKKERESKGEEKGEMETVTDREKSEFK